MSNNSNMKKRGAASPEPNVFFFCSPKPPLMLRHWRTLLRVQKFLLLSIHRNPSLRLIMHPVTITTTSMVKMLLSNMIDNFTRLFILRPFCASGNRQSSLLREDALADARDAREIQHIDSNLSEVETKLANANAALADWRANGKCHFCFFDHHPVILTRRP